MSPLLDDLEPAPRDALRRLARGEDPAEAGRPRGRSGDEVLALASEALVALAGDPGDDVSPRQRAAVRDYLLGRQSPGQAAGTWAQLEASDAMRRWAAAAREQLADVVAAEPPALPGERGALSPTQRARRSPGAGAPTLAERRRLRSRQRTQQAVQVATAEAMSPFRSEALDEQRTADEELRVPHYASRPVRVTMVVLVGLLVAALAGVVFLRVPVTTNAVVLVVQVPADAPGDVEGYAAMAIFPEQDAPDDRATGADVTDRDTLRVALAGQRERIGMPIGWVSDGPVAPRQVIEGYELPLGQANRVAVPSYVALAPLRTPGDRRARSFEGTVTTEASVQVSDQRIISLLF